MGLLMECLRDTTRALLISPEYGKVNVLSFSFSFCGFIPIVFSFLLNMLFSSSKNMLLQAWFRRGKANASLGIFEDSIRDLNISLKLETSIGGKRQIQVELETILNQSKEMNGSSKQSNESYLDIHGTSLFPDVFHCWWIIISCIKMSNT